MAEHSPLRVLIAEDNELNRKVLLAFLDRLGHEPDVAVDGPEALDRIGESTYDLILMDIRMPGMNGVEVTRNIRALGRNIGQPHIVGVSASVLESDRPVFAEAGIDDFLAKPIRLKELEAVIAERP
ncbi:MAG: response regulator [Acidimicrobiales bacterium]